MSTQEAETTLAAADWRARATAHTQAVRAWTRPYARRRAAAMPHPVHDFLFTYYHYSLQKLEAWHPGVGHALEDDGQPCPWASSRFYQLDGGAWRLRLGELDAACAGRLSWSLGLLRATAARPGNFACHGLHEWAMVYRASEIRHAESAPLRLPQAQVDALVESQPLVCTHFDAFRFFTPDARPRNRHAPTLELRPQLEQPGCVHANMDLYKWAYKAMPWIGSDLLMQTFHLAMDLRELDMRASPYDLRAFGYQPIPIESAEGRATYQEIQRQLAARAASVRACLIHSLERVLAHAEVHR